MLPCLSTLFRLLQNKLPEVEGNPSSWSKAMQVQFKCKHYIGLNRGRTWVDRPKLQIPLSLQWWQELIYTCQVSSCYFLVVIAFQCVSRFFWGWVCLYWIYKFLNAPGLASLVVLPFLTKKERQGNSWGICVTNLECWNSFQPGLNLHSLNADMLIPLSRIASWDWKGLPVFFMSTKISKLLETRRPWGKVKLKMSLWPLWGCCRLVCFWLHISGLLCKRK